MGLVRRHREVLAAVSSAFTLLEILLALALIGLLGGLVVTGANRLLAQGPVSAEDVFWKAVTEARKYALLRGQEVRLAYEAKSKTFEATTSEGSRKFPVPFDGELTIDFLSASSAGRSTVLIGGTLVETRPMPFVTFYPDGTCSSFRVQLRSRGGEPRYLQIDPWTCAAIKDKTTTR